MFDVAASGPLVGFAASLAALAIGAQLSLTSDPSIMPALPVDILRQSTLGGSIVDSIIQGSLYVPEGADSSGLMVSLHPLAVAGYVSMIVNALALLPVGSTCIGIIIIGLVHTRCDKRTNEIFFPTKQLTVVEWHWRCSEEIQRPSSDT